MARTPFALTRGRGLKHHILRRHVGSVKFALTRGRGLKPQKTLIQGAVSTFALTRGRGLKLEDAKSGLLAGGSPSREGVD